MAARVLKQLERQLILYDIFQTNYEDTRLDTIQYHLPGIKIRTLQRDIKDLSDAGVLLVYFSREKDAYINYGENLDNNYYSEGILKRISRKRKLTREKTKISPKKKEHLERIKRLTTLMGCAGSIKANELYFELFPDATERMRKRDFEVLRHIGFIAGFYEEENDYVIYRDDRYGIDNNYGIFVRDEKMMHYV